MEPKLELYVEELGKYLAAELHLLHDFCKTNLSGRAKTAIVVAASACSTGNAIFLLSKNPDYFYSETIMLARSFLEKISNYCYLQICSELEFESYLAYPFYRSYHNAERIKYAGNHKVSLKYMGQDSMLENPQIRDALSKFSSTNPRMKWSKLSLDEKIAKITEASKISPAIFLISSLATYSDASEALHGTLYGCALSTGVYIPGTDNSSPEKIKENTLKSTALLYIQMGTLIHKLLSMFSEMPEIKPLFAASKKNDGEALSIMKLIFNKK